MAAIAKLSQPRVEGVIQRQRLFARLDEITGGACAWIAGPPGSGKTSLTSSWLEARGLKALWYQVDSGDEDIASFFHYLGMAAAEAGLIGKGELPAFTAGHLADLGAFARRWFRALWQHAPRPIAFVLDDYQEVSAAAGLHAVIREALAEAPQDVRVVVVSRSEPPAELARVRANRRLVEVGWEELRLTVEEAGGLAQAAGASGRTDVGALVLRCDGWAAGLVLLLDQPGGAGPDPVTPRSRRAMFDYFAAELFGRLSEEMQVFLLRTCLAPWLDAAMAAELSGSGRAGELLEELRRKHLFTELMGETRYRYHDLFREFLKARLQQRYPEQERVELTRASARLLEAAGDHGAAFELFLEASSFVEAVKVVLGQAGDLLLQGRHQTLEMWTGLLPKEVLQASPWLNYWRAMSIFPADRARARRRLETAFEAFEKAGDGHGMVLTASGVIELIYLESFLGADVGPIDRWIAATEVAIGKVAGQPDLELVGYASLMRAGLIRAPDPERLELWRGKVMELMGVIPLVSLRVRAATAMIHYLEFRGVARELQELEELIAPQLTHPRLAPAIHCQWLINQALSQVVFLDQEDRAFAQLEQALAIAREHAVVVALPFIHMVLAHLCLMRGEADEAQRWLASAPASERGGLMDCLAGLAAVQQGRGGEGLELARRGHERILAGGGWMAAMMSSQLLAAVQAAAGDLEGALATAQANAALGKPLPDGARIYDAGLSEAYARLGLGDEAGAAAGLARQLGVWSERGVGASAVWPPQVMSPLFAFALERGIEPDLVRRMIRRRRLAPPSPEADGWPWPVRLSALGGFSVSVDGAPLPKGRKAPKKLLVVLKSLIALGGQSVPEERLADLLWPDHDGDDARDLLANVILRLRRLLGDPAAIEVHEGRVSLSPERVWADVRSFERFADRALAAPEREGEAAERAIELYAGAFLADEPDLPGSHELRDRLSGKYLRLVSERGLRLEGGDKTAAAAHLYARAVEAEPAVESFHQGLMRTLAAQGRRAEALAAYRRLERMLQQTFQSRPSRETQALHSALLAG